MQASPQRTIVHVDMDAFYASVEQLDQPQFRDQAVIVGGLGARGVVSTASYEARRFGVHSAMPMVQARRLCPRGIYLPPRMSRYRQISRQVFAIFGRYTPLVEGLSLDEAFLDVSASLRLFGGAAAIAEDIRRAIREETGLSAAVGVAPNKFLAKLSSDLAKPGGIKTVHEERIQRLLDPLPVRRLWGVGKKTGALLQRAGILTIGQLRQLPAVDAGRLLGNQAAHFQALARGEDDRPVCAESQSRSISHEETFAENIRDPEQLLAILQGQVESVARQLREQQLTARCVVLKLRDGRFQTATRSKTLPEPTSETRLLYATAKALVEHWWRREGGKALRLLGMGVSQIAELERFHGEVQNSHLDSTLDDIHKKFGAHGVQLGRSLLKNR